MNHTDIKQSSHSGSIPASTAGLVLSVFFTLAAYLMVVTKAVSQTHLTALLIFLALCQVVVQLIFFLHLGTESKPRWQLFFLVLTIFSVMTVALGSLWIMKHLDYNMMPEIIEQKIIEDELPGLNSKH